MARKSRKPFAISEDDHSGYKIIYNTAAYVRLSVEDTRKKTSGSIDTQKALLLEFLARHSDLRLYNIYEDINYSGTSFDRPSFLRMLDDIKAGAVNCVLVKDLSRFGRSFSEAGHFLERVFPSLGVRFISINDSYDSLTASIDEGSLIVPLKNLLNEFYAREISKKTQAGFKQKRERSEFCGAFAPYGYLKAGTSLIIDAETAPVVKKIFGWVLEGYSDIRIAKSLNDMNIPPPSRYRFDRGIVCSDRYAKAKLWHKSAIKRISENPVYTGALAQCRYQSSFLSGGGTMEKNREDWLIQENTHQAIISGTVFEAVRKIRDARKHRSDKPKTHSISKIADALEKEREI